MTNAEKMLDRWLNDTKTIDSVEGLAREIDPRCRVDSFLYTERKRIIFSDASIAVYAANCLRVER